MPLTLTPDKIRRRGTPVKKDRTAQLRAAGYVYRDLSKRAGVSYSMARKWCKRDRTSWKVQAAFDWLLGHPKGGKA